MTNRWFLYLDDERIPKTLQEWTIARSVKEAQSLVLAKGCPSIISFDHDLGNSVLTGHDFAKWLIEQDLNGEIQFPEDFSFSVHSANPVGRDNINSILISYFKFKRNR